MKKAIIGAMKILAAELDLLDEQFGSEDSAPVVVGVSATEVRRC